MPEPGKRTAHNSAKPAPLGQTPGANMIKSQQVLKALAMIAGLCALSACQSMASLPDTSPVAKVDSGLGELPHYRDWIDPSGRMAMDSFTTARESTRWP
jgi:hypothetical protein